MRHQISFPNYKNRIVSSIWAQNSVGTKKLVVVTDIIDNRASYEVHNTVNGTIDSFILIELAVRAYNKIELQ